MLRDFLDGAMVKSKGCTGTGGGPSRLVLLHLAQVGTMFEVVCEPPLLNGVM